MKILVLNAGSATLKYGIFAMPEEQCLIRGVEEGFEHSPQSYQRLFDNALTRWHIDAIGHRVVHGGTQFTQPTLIDDEVVRKITQTIPLAPLHNPANLAGIQQAMQCYPNAAQVAVFDTAFHLTLPEHAYRYAINEALYTQHHIRRYGFHGIAHHYLATESARFLQRPLETLNLITLHLGGGASACAIQNGKSIDTSMGMTPLEGLIMGSRCGDIDPGILLTLLNTGMSPETLTDELNQRSGLKGLCNTQDMRKIEGLTAEGATQAQLALQMFCYRIQKYVGAYLAILGRLDGLVFSGGIGEHSSLVRSLICRSLGHFNLVIDDVRNQNATESVTAIQQEGRTPILVIAANEELAIARQTQQVIATEV